MKKGFTILELIISMALISIITTISITVFLKYNNIFKVNAKQNTEQFYIKEALMYIEKEINEGNGVINVLNNQIQIEKIHANSNNIKGIHTIRLNSSGNITINCDKGIEGEGTNVILRKVKSFTMEEKNKLVYVKIVREDGEEFQRCFVLNLIE